MPVAAVGAVPQTPGKVGKEHLRGKSSSKQLILSAFLLLSFRQAEFWTYLLHSDEEILEVGLLILLLLVFKSSPIPSPSYFQTLKSFSWLSRT